MIEALRKIYALLSPQRQRQVLWLVAGMFAMSFAELGLVGAISLLGVALAAPASLEKIEPLWALFRMLPDYNGNIPQSIRLFILVLGVVCVATALKNLLMAAMTYWQGWVSQCIGWDMGIRIFNNYVHAPYVWHTQRNPAELGSYIGWRASVAAFFLGGLQFASQMGILFFLMAGAFAIAPLIALLLFGVSASVALLVYKGAQHKVRRTGEIIAQLGIETGKVVHCALHGIREVQIYNQQNAFSGHFASYARPTARAVTKQGVYSSLPSWFLETIGMALLLGAVIFMAMRGDSMANVTGTLTLMAAVSWRLLPALNKIVGGVLQLKASISPVQILLTHYLTMPRTSAEAVHYTFEQTLALHNVSFRYPNTRGEALHQVNLTIPKGSMTGLIGLSGAGKSTLVGILTGLLTPNAGKILLDGRETAPSPGFLRIGYVPQNPYIIDASLSENVALCDWMGALDEDRVRECCRMAAMDFLDDLPEGIHTVLGDRGVRLSGGQVQRVAIARALYGEPDILLFDEATSALDGAAETAIQSTILGLRKDMTVVLVAHRLTTIQGCDTLYWLEGGTVVRYGAAKDVLPEYETFLQSHSDTESEVTSIKT